MDGINFIQDLAVVMIAAGLVGVACQRLGLSVIVGYLLAGVIIGPYTPPFSYISDIARIQTLSQVGLVFLMFSIGLGLSLRKLRRLGASAAVATALAALLVFEGTRVLGWAVGWSPGASLFVAAMLMVSSSAVISKVLEETQTSHERHGQLALGVTVLEDVVAVVMLTLLASITRPDALGAGGSLGSVVGGLSAFVVLLVMSGLLFLPRLLRRFRGGVSGELQTIAVVGVLFALALVAQKAGYSLALGAFLLGAIVAEMPQRTEIERDFTGMRDVFSSVFFVSIGMMIDVRMLVEVWPAVLGLTVFTLSIRWVATGAGLILVGTPPDVARRAGLALTPLGEFSFIIAQMGVTAGVLSERYYPIAVGVSILTVLLAPWLNRHSEGIVAGLERAEPRRVRRLLEVYHEWLDRLQRFQRGSLWWQMSRKRLGSILLEVLFVSGLLIFSEHAHAALGAVWQPAWLNADWSEMIFWTALGLLALAPLVAIWRNVEALALIYADLLSRGQRQPYLTGPVVENGVKVGATLLLALWLGSLLPLGRLPLLGWLLVATVLGGVVWFFSRRLVRLHSEWQNSLQEALAGAPAASEQRASRLEGEGEWNFKVVEFAVPESATYAGKSISEIGLRSRSGCTIVEIDRQGFLISAPDPMQPLYPGDRLLLLGEPSQIAAAQRLLSEKRAVAEGGEEFSETTLVEVAVGESPRAGRTLAELNVTRHTGVIVVGIERDGVRIPNPTGNEVIRSGDSLLVVGRLEEVRAFRTWLESME